MRRGYTLLDMALTLCVAGLLTGIVVPRAAGLLDSAVVEAAAQELVGAHHRARIAALAAGRPIVLVVSPDTLTIRFPDSAGAVWRRLGPRAHGISLGGPVRQLVFSPVGLTMGASNATFVLSRGGAVRTVVVSRLGRVRILR